MAQILSFKTLVISTILFLFTALLLKLTIPASRELVTSVVPQVWTASLHSKSKTFNLFLIINAIIIAIAASSGFLHHRAQDPPEIRQDPEVLDEDARGPPPAEEEEEEEKGSFDVKVADPSILSQDPTEIRVDPNSWAATAYEETDEEHFADCKSDWVRELRDPTEIPAGAVRVGNGKSMKASFQETKELEMMGPTSNETLESVWKRIMENSNNKCDTSDHPQSDLISIQRSSLSPFLNSPKPKKPIPRHPSPSRDELNRQVQSFINKINEQMRQQRRNSSLRLGSARDSKQLTQEFTANEFELRDENDNSSDLFEELEVRFLRFKKHQFLANSARFQQLAEAQAPKFMVIACADSRVCPSSILGFQPGEAFTVRNIANLVPPFENGPSETSAGLEFAVNSLEVGNIFIIGHSCCGGIRALMSMQDEVNSSGSFIRDWVVIGKNAKLRTKAAAANLSFDQQCRYCEKESVNRSLLNLLTYPWIEERVSKGILCLHGGYYDFVRCTFEKWTLDYKGSMEVQSKLAIKNYESWGA